jgi:glycosyltransferase involved in cell wall biosynthesis
MQAWLPVAANGAVPVLYVADKMLSPNLDGGSLRALNMLRALRGIGCPVTFVGHYPDSFPPYSDTFDADTARLEELGVEVAAPSENPFVSSHLVEHGHRYGLVILSPYSIAYRYLSAVREHAPQALAVHMALDLGHVQHYRRARRTGNIPDLRRALEAKQQETWLASHADCTLACSEEEREVLLGLCPEADVRVAAHIVEPNPAPIGYAERQGLLFLGSFPHVANVDAVQYFVREILPEIRTAIPDITLEIIGTDPPEEVTGLAGPCVTVSGRVPDLDPYFARTRVFVAPLRHGAGIKIKVLESLGRGVPTVVTPVAAEGLHLSDGVDTLIADTPQDFANAVIRLHADEELWRRIVAGGFELLERHFSQQNMEKTLAGLLELAHNRGVNRATAEDQRSDSGA